MISYPIEAAGIQSRIIEHGAGNNVAVFLHGAGARADRWVHNLPGFADQGWRCYAIDLPGHGFALKRGDLRFDPASMRVFLAGVLNQIGVSQCVLVGTSYGGLLSLDFAEAHPERMRALVLVGCLGLAPLDAQSRQRMARALVASSREEIRFKLERLVFDQSLVSDSWVEEDFRINNSPGAAAALGSLARYVNDEGGLGAVPLGSTLRTVSTQLPTALFWGVHDRSVPVSVGRAAQADAPGVTWIEMEQTCHAPYWERPDAFNNAVLNFLALNLSPRLTGTFQ